MKNLCKKLLSTYLILIIIFSFWIFYPAQTNAAQTLGTNAQVQMSDSRPSQTAVTYTATWLSGQTAAIQCIKVAFATNADMTGGVPSGMTTTSSAFNSISGNGITSGHWSGNYYNGTNGTLQFEASQQDTLIGSSWATTSATTVTNTSLTTFYAQITSYSTVSSHTCSTIVDQTNVIALQTLSGVATSVTVAPTLTLSIADHGSAVNGSGDSSPVTTTSTTIPFGTVAAGATAWGSQTATVSTNAVNGYTLYVSDTGTMTDTASHTFRDQIGTPTSANSFDGSSSQSSFAYTADGNVTFGSNKWAGLGNSHTQYQIQNVVAAANNSTIHIEFKVEPANTQPAGTYTTTVIYTAVGSF